MIEAIGGGPETTLTEREEKLREATEQMEGVFVSHLMKALRSTVPNGGNPDAPGADLYGSLLDEHFAEVIAGDTQGGIAEALYRQLSSMVQNDSGEGSTS